MGLRIRLFSTPLYIVRVGRVEGGACLRIENNLEEAAIRMWSLKLRPPPLHVKGRRSPKRVWQTGAHPHSATASKDLEV